MNETESQLDHDRDGGAAGGGARSGGKGAARRRALIDAAVVVVADDGLKGLTHRAVDARAGLPLGSAANVFRTRQALLDAVVDDLEQRDAEAFSAYAASNPGSPGELIRLLVDAVQTMTGAVGATSTRVRLQLMSAAPDRVRAGHERMRDQLDAQLTDLGVDQAPARARAIAALLDGAMLHTLTVAPDAAGSCELEGALGRLLT